MLDVYPVYLKLGWKHSVSCVSRTSQTRNTHHRRESTCCPYAISRRIAAAAGARTGSSGSGTSSSLASAAGATLPAHRARSGLGLAAGGIAACLPRHCAPSDVKLTYLYSYLSILCTCVSGCVSGVYLLPRQKHTDTRVSAPLTQCI